MLTQQEIKTIHVSGRLPYLSLCAWPRLVVLSWARSQGEGLFVDTLAVLLLSGHKGKLVRKPDL